MAVGKDVAASRRGRRTARSARAGGVALERRTASRRFHVALAVIAASGFAARIAVVSWIPTQPVSDFRDYFLRAVALAQTNSYDTFPQPPDAAYPPGYPLLLFLATALLPGIDHLFAAKIANCVLGLATIGIGGRVARELGGDRAGLVAALVFAFYPRQLLLPCLVASENLFTPLLLLFLLVVMRAARGPTALPHALGAGILVGSMALTRTVGYGLGVAWAVAGAAAGRKPRRLAAELALLLLVQHAVMLPWALRNRRALGSFSFLTSTGGIGLFIGNNANATGDWYPWQADLARLRPGVFAASPVEIDRAAREEAVEWIEANPGWAAMLYIERMRHILVEDHLAGDWAIFAEKISPPEPGIPVLPGPHPLKLHRAAVMRILRVAGLMLAAFGAGGAFLLWRAVVRERSPYRRAALVAIVTSAVYLLLCSAVIAVNGRYRWPIEDLCVPLAALFLARFAEPAARGRSDTLAFQTQGRSLE